MSVTTNSSNIPSVNNTAVVGTGTGFSTIGYSSSSSTANNLVQRNANGKAIVSGLILDTTSTVSGGTINLTSASTQYQSVTGLATTTMVLPNATTLSVGQTYVITNVSTGTLTIQTFGGTFLATAIGGAVVQISLINNGSTVGNWNVSYLMPINTQFGYSLLSISGGITASGAVRANNFKPGYATTATSGGTTALVNSSAQLQYFTGTSTQTVTLADVTGTGFNLGQSVTIVNKSTGTVTVQSFDTTTIQVMAANTQLVATCISLTDNSATGWSIFYYDAAAYPTFSGDTGTSFSSNTLTVRANNGSNLSGHSVSFDASTPYLNLRLTDTYGGTFLGQGAGNATPAGGGLNTAVGYNSTQQPLIGNGNSGFGANTLVNLTDGNANLACGAGSLALIEYDNNNVALGTNSLNQLVGTSGSPATDNIAIGYNSGTDYISNESNNILLNSPGSTSDQNTLRIGNGTGTGNKQLSRSYVSGIANPTLVSGAPTPYLISQDITTDQLQALTPVAANTASSTFGSLAVGTALRNTANYPILVNVSMAITTSTSAVILVGVGSTNTPTAQAVTASFSVAAATTFGFSFVVPAKYYARVTTTGTISVGSITTFASQIG